MLTLESDERDMRVGLDHVSGDVTVTLLGHRWRWGRERTRLVSDHGPSTLVTGHVMEAETPADCPGCVEFVSIERTETEPAYRIHSLQSIGWVPFFTIFPYSQREPRLESDWRCWVQGTFPWILPRCRVGNYHWFFDFRRCTCDKEAMTQYADGVR